MKKIIFLTSLFSLGCLLPIQADVNECAFELRARYKRAGLSMQTFLVAAGLRRISASDRMLSPEEVSKINNVVQKLKEQSQDPLTGATNLEFDFTQIEAKGLSLGGCNFLSFKRSEYPLFRAVGSKLDRLNLENTKLVRADFAFSEIKNSNMEDVRVDSSCFDSAIIENTNFSNASLSTASLKRAHVIGNNFKRASLPESNWEKSSVRNNCLEEAFLKKSNFNRSFFSRNNLSGADLGGSDFRLTKFYENKVDERTNVTGSCFAGVSKEDLNQFRRAVGYKNIYTTFAACRDAGFNEISVW